MANITINEISQNYTYSTSNNSFATVALPMTACWGPGFFNSQLSGDDLAENLETTTWEKFPATRQGLEAFVATYRGPAANYRATKDMSYHTALTLLTSGYDVLVCRVCGGSAAAVSIPGKDQARGITLRAKYPGTFGNNVIATLKSVPLTRDNDGNVETCYWNLLVYVVDNTGVKTAVENLTFVRDIANSSDTLLHISEVESDFVVLTECGDSTDTPESLTTMSDDGLISYTLVGGSDTYDEEDRTLEQFVAYRYPKSGDSDSAYAIALEAATANASNNDKFNWLQQELNFDNACMVYELLKDRLTYSPNYIISPWDDFDFSKFDATWTKAAGLSKLHRVIMDVAYWSRCATGLLDIPRSLIRSQVWEEGKDTANSGYAQQLSRYLPSDAAMTIDSSLYSSHCALFGPWGQYTYVGTTKKQPAAPSLLYLLMNKGMLDNQPVKYFWQVPSNRSHKVDIGKLDYTVNAKVLDDWQGDDGVGINVITSLPHTGITVWGNSTLYEVPAAVYNALQNLSTRNLMNAVKDIVFRAGLSITFSYNNSEAYSKFYTACSPLLDTMKTVGAITDYKIKMSDALDGTASVDAQSVIGKIWLTINGVITRISVDLIALPSNTDLSNM